MNYPDPMDAFRQSDQAVDPQFLRRWSPRSMSGEVIAPATMMTMLEAARWAPSSGNTQPWRFIYAFRDTPYFARLFAALNPGNQIWCAKAGALLLLASQTQSEKRGQILPLTKHSFDAGAAWMSLALQGNLLNMVVHAMGGFDPALARTATALPSDYEPEAMIAVGHPAPTEELPEKLRDREKPSGRNKVGEFAFEGKWVGGEKSSAAQ